MNKLGYSYALSERNDERLMSLNNSMEMLLKTDEILKNFKSIQFELVGNVEDKNLSLMVNYKTNAGKEGQEEFSSYVDEGAIEIDDMFIQAYFGMERYSNIKKELDDNYGILEANYLKFREPELFQQLSEEYLLQCSPDTNNGCEFTESDKIFFKDILNKE